MDVLDLTEIVNVTIMTKSTPTRQSTYPTLPLTLPSSTGAYRSRTKQLVNDNNHVGPGHDIHLRPFVCDFSNCDRAFARKSDLARHYRIHTNDRPYICTVEDCGKAFIQRSALTVHTRVHTGERPHHCETCDKAFADSSSLARHRRIHTGKRPYGCKVPDCGRSFARRNTYLKHFKRQHPDLPPPSSAHVRAIHIPSFRMGGPHTFLPSGSVPSSAGLSEQFARTSSQTPIQGQFYPLSSPATVSTPSGIAAPHPSEGVAYNYDGGFNHTSFHGQTSTTYHSSGNQLLVPSHSGTVRPHLQPIIIHTPNSQEHGQQQGQGKGEGNSPASLNISLANNVLTPSSTVPVSAANGGDLEAQQQQTQNLQPPASAVSSDATGATSTNLGPPQYTGSSVFAYSDHSISRDQTGNFMMYYNHPEKNGMVMSSGANEQVPSSAVWPVWGSGVGGGFAPSQIALPPSHIQAAVYYHSTPEMATPITTGKVETVTSIGGHGASDHLEKDLTPEPLVEITNIPSIKFQPSIDGPPLPMTAMPTHHHHHHPHHSYTHDFTVTTRLHSAPPHLQRFHSLPAVPTLSNGWNEIEPYHGPGGYGDAHSIGGGRSGEEEEWEQLEEEMLSRDASEGVEDNKEGWEKETLAASASLSTNTNAGSTMSPVINSMATATNGSWAAVSAVNHHQQSRYPSSASTASTTSTFANLTQTPYLQSELPPVSVFAYSAPPNQTYLFPTPITPAQIPNTALPAHAWGVKSTAIDSQVVLARDYFPMGQEVIDSHHDQSNGTLGGIGAGDVQDAPYSPLTPGNTQSSLDIHDITLATPPQPSRRDGTVATVGLGIANVHFDERGDEAIVVSKWEEEVDVDIVADGEGDSQVMGKGKKGKDGGKKKKNFKASNVSVMVKNESTNLKTSIKGRKEVEVDNDADAEDSDEGSEEDLNDDSDDEFVPSGKIRKLFATSKSKSKTGMTVGGLKRKVGGIGSVKKGKGFSSVSAKRRAAESIKSKRL